MVNGETRKSVSAFGAVMLAIFVAAALIHFNGWARSNYLQVTVIMYASAIAAIGCSLFWWFTKEGSLKSSEKPAMEQEADASPTAPDGRGTSDTEGNRSLA